jgi:hypothetical protein
MSYENNVVMSPKIVVSIDAKTYLKVLVVVINSSHYS